MANTPPEPPDAQLAELARGRGIADERVLDAIASLRRADFLPSQVREQAGRDRALPLAAGQTTSQPTLIALMLSALEIAPSANVLEVGTGCGYQTALLARLAARVTSIEWFEELARSARDNLAEAGFTDVEVLCGDGALGHPEQAPYDVIVISAATPEVPGPLAAQLREGGLLVAPIGSTGVEEVTLFERIGSQLVRRSNLIPARFVPLLGNDPSA